MVPDEISIYNLALNAVGARSNLSSTTERDRGAEVCRLWYPVIRDQILAAAPWPSCKTFKRLALLKQQTEETWVTGDPEPGYAFIYSAPSDMLHPRYISDYTRFAISSYENEIKALSSNCSAPILVYTRRNYIVASWENELQMAIAYGLAANIAMPLTAKPQRAQLLVQQANDLVLTARVAAANEDNEINETIPDWIAARGYANPATPRWYYPVGAMLQVPNVR